MFPMPSAVLGVGGWQGVGGRGSDAQSWRDLTSRHPQAVLEVLVATERQLRTPSPTVHSPDWWWRVEGRERRISSPTDEFCGLIWLLYYTVRICHLQSALFLWNACPGSR